MKLLLDAHISGTTVGKALTERGHDVRAIDSESERGRSAPPRSGHSWMRWLLMGVRIPHAQTNHHPGHSFHESEARPQNSTGFELALGDANLLSEEHGIVPLGV
jgi:hypothetical protein